MSVVILTMIDYMNSRAPPQAGPEPEVAPSPRRPVAPSPVWLPG